VSLPLRIRRCLDDRVNSFAKLRLTSALMAAPDRCLTFAQLCKAVGESSDRIDDYVDDAAGFVERDTNNTIHLVVQEHELEILTELVALNQTDPFTVARYLAESSIRRLRAMAGVFLDVPRHPRDDE
jgi:hypothetical protein